MAKGSWKSAQKGWKKGCERGQPTKKKVDCKFLSNRTAKQRQVWLQIKGERGQRRVEKKRAKKTRKSRVKANKTKRKIDE